MYRSCGCMWVNLYEQVNKVYVRDQLVCSKLVMASGIMTLIRMAYRHKVHRLLTVQPVYKLWDPRRVRCWVESPSRLNPEVQEKKQRSLVQQMDKSRTCIKACLKSPNDPYMHYRTWKGRTRFGQVSLYILQYLEMCVTDLQKFSANFPRIKGSANNARQVKPRQLHNIPQLTFIAFRKCTLV